MSDILPVSMQNFLYCRKSELREQISRFRTFSKQRSEIRCLFYEQKVTGKDFQKDESDS